jgi:hypothetical protein
VLTVDHTQQPAVTAAADGLGDGPGAYAWQQQQQEQQGLKLAWVTVEEFLEGSCVGTASTAGATQHSSSSSGGSSSSEVRDWITAEGIAGGKQFYPGQQQQQQQQHFYSPCDNVHTPVATSDAGKSAAAGYKVITAVWLPYGNDARELFWSYKVALRHFNSHALVNAAMWVRFQEDSSVDHCSSSSSKTPAGAGSNAFAGRTVASARLFVGFPQQESAAPAAAAAAGLAGAGAGFTQQQRSVEEAWRVMRLPGVEQQLQGRAVDVQVRPLVVDL